MKNFMRSIFPLILLFMLSGKFVSCQSFDYPSPEAVNETLRNIRQSNPSITEIHLMAKSPGDNEVLMIEIGKEISSADKTIPAILVVGNLEGSRPIGSLAAIKLAELIIEGEYFNQNTWYIIPAGNPDAAYTSHDTPVYENHRNAEPVNDDNDELTDEDKYNDLNNDGFITHMRVKHPEGEWIAVDDEIRLMRKADPAKAEEGVYRIYSEGLDDDRDGKYNEDLPGGININRNFPHLFNHSDPESGLYPGSSPEARSIIEFAYAHPEIAMTFSYGATNFCYEPPKGGRKGEVDLQNIKVPERIASSIGADPEKSYSMKEIIEMVQPLVPAGITVDENMVASFLGLGAVVNPLEPDLVMYNKFAEDYKNYLKDKNIQKERFEPEKARDGSFELWSYYHLGVPVFSMDLWSVPRPGKKSNGNELTVEKLAAMNSEEFLALGEEKIGDFLKEKGVPDQFSAEKVMEIVKSGKMDPEKLSGMIKQMPEKKKGGADPQEEAMLLYSDEVLDGYGFVDWQKFEHPELGEVEIGGFLPFIKTTPARAVADSVINLKIPWIFELVKELPSLVIYDSRVNPKGKGIYELELWIGNESYIPFPIAMGKRNKQPAPAVVSLNGEGFLLLSGLSRTAVEEVGGKSRTKLSWLIKAEENTEITVDLTTRSAGNDQKTIKIGG